VIDVPTPCDIKMCACDHRPCCIYRQCFRYVVFDDDSALMVCDENEPDGPVYVRISAEDAELVSYYGGAQLAASQADSWMYAPPCIPTCAATNEFMADIARADILRGSGPIGSPVQVDNSGQPN